jgi:hypothetical protein
MRTTFRFLLIAIVVIGLLGTIGTGVASWWVMRKLGPDFWVELIEKNTHCRADISDVKLSLLTRPSTLKLKNVRLAPLDAEVAKPLGDRAPLAVDAAPIVIPEVTLEVQLEDLLSRRLFIQRLSFMKPVVKEFQDDQGNSSLEQLFSKDSPDVAIAPPAMAPVSPAPPRYNEALPAASPHPVPRATPITQIPTPAPQPSAAADSPETEDPSNFAISVASAEIEQGHFTIVNRNTTTEIQNLDFSITGIDFTPHATNPPNQMHVAIAAEIDVNGMARIGGVKRPAKLAHLKLTGTGDVTPIDARTGEWNPRTTLKLTLAKGSVLAGHMTIGDAAGKEVRKLQEYGVDLTPVPIGGMLQQDVIVDGVFVNNRFTLKAPTRFFFPDYELAIGLHSWINGAEDQHSMRVQLSCGPALQQHLESGIAQAKLGDSIAQGVTKALSDEQGRMTFDIESSGPLSDPKIKPELDRILKNLLRGEGLGDLLKGLFKKL